MTVYPVAPVTLPAVCTRYANGQIPQDEMRQVDATLGRFGWLVEPAARSHAALVDAATKAGFRLRATGYYRSLADQEALFRSRYTPHPMPPGKLWRLRWWRKNPGVASAATPGTSNHGLGIAADFAEETDGDPAAESLTGPLLAWLLDNAASFGWSWELQSEPWHLRYVAGDVLPARVIEFERGRHPSTNHRRSDPVFLAKHVADTTNPNGQVWLIDGNKRHALSTPAVSVYRRRPEVDPVIMILTGDELNAFPAAV